MERVINAALNFLFYICLGLGILFLVPIRLSRRIQEALFARLFFPVAMLLFNDKLRRVRRPTVCQLNELLSHDGTLRKQGTLRVLEVGAGSGANLEHVERKVLYWTLDPNPEFGDDLRKQLKRNPNVTMERWIQACAEDMRGVPDGHFDVVLMTYVLCSATDPERVLAECKRVLAKGGRLLFAEHVAHPEGSWGLALQRNLDPLWTSIGCGCHADRRSGDVLANAGFAHLQLNELLLPMPTPVSRHLWGYAESPRNECCKVKSSETLSAAVPCSSTTGLQSGFLVAFTLAEEQWDFFSRGGVRPHNYSQRRVSHPEQLFPDHCD